MLILTKQLQDLGLSIYESEMTLFLIEDWLKDYYPILAQLYHVEILRKELAPRSTQVQLIPVKSQRSPLLMEEVSKWRDTLVQAC